MEDTTLFKKSKAQNKLNSITTFINSFKNKMISSNDNNYEIIKMLNEAHDEWKNAENLFEYVTEPDLIDYAIFKMEAARMKYIYLLKQARREGIKVDM